jgi:hypothetical protein
VETLPRHQPFLIFLQPYTLQVEVGLVGTPSHFTTAFGPADRVLLKVADSSGEDSIGVWRDAIDTLRQLDVQKGPLLEVSLSGITRTKNNTLATTNKYSTNSRHPRYILSLS